MGSISVRNVKRTSIVGGIEMLKGRNLLSPQDLSSDEIEAGLNKAVELKKKLRQRYWFLTE